MPLATSVIVSMSLAFGRDWISVDSDHVPDAAPMITIDKDAFARFTPEPADEITVYSPNWCAACKTWKAKLGDGDAITRLKWVDSTPNFRPAKETYPVFYHAKNSKQLIGPIPETMDGLRSAFGIKPAPQTHVAAIDAGSVSRALIDDLAWFFRSDGKPRVFGPLSMTVPRNNGAAWETVGNVTTIKLTKPVRISMGLVSKDVTTVTYDEKRVTLVLDWMPDLSLEVK